MADAIEEYRGCILQHGKHNDRVYLMKLDASRVPSVIRHIDDLVVENEYTKVFGKVPERARSVFQASGYDIEAVVEDGYGGVENLYFMTKYFSGDRRNLPGPARDSIKTIVSQALLKHSKAPAVSTQETLRKARPSDAERIASLYGEVFDTYPFPIDDPAYVERTMHGGTDYYVLEREEEIRAVAAAEKYPDCLNVELTDFATRKGERGKGYALRLLSRMEDAMRGEGMKTAYTIARAMEPGINMVFGGSGYKYCGLLRNNTNICGSLESMNVWGRSL